MNQKKMLKKRNFDFEQGISIAIFLVTSLKDVLIKCLNTRNIFFDGVQS